MEEQCHNKSDIFILSRKIKPMVIFFHGKHKL